jgi:hypothetical protein
MLSKKNQKDDQYINQLIDARQLAQREGIDALRQHARVGKSCRCKNCFTCAAWAVLGYLTVLDGKGFDWQSDEKRGGAR